MRPLPDPNSIATPLPFLHLSRPSQAIGVEAANRIISGAVVVNTIVKWMSRRVFGMCTKRALNFYLFCILAFIPLSFAFANIDIN